MTSNVLQEGAPLNCKAESLAHPFTAEGCVLIFQRQVVRGGGAVGLSSFQEFILSAINTNESNCE